MEQWHKFENTGEGKVLSFSPPEITSFSAQPCRCVANIYVLFGLVIARAIHRLFLKSINVIILSILMLNCTLNRDVVCVCVFKGELSKAIFLFETRCVVGVVRCRIHGMELAEIMLNPGTSRLQKGVSGLSCQ